MGISVIISHFAPKGNEDKWRNILLKTIRSIRSQKVNFQVEIIVCDDGSTWSSSIGGDPDTIIDLSKSQISKLKIFKDLDVDRYLYINSGDKYYRARLLHYAYSNAKYSKIVTLDDDHQFTNKKSLMRYYNYLNKYDFVRGRIMGSDGTPQLFSSTSVQGTNQGFTKSIYKKIGGLGYYLFEGLSGADDDLTWKIYDYLSRNYPNQKKACFAGEIITHNAKGSRWVNNSFSNYVDAIKDLKKRHDEINRIFNRKFFQEYGINPIGNPSRNKSLWMEFPSLTSRLFEIYYTLIYYYKNFPLTFKKKYKRFRKFIQYCKTHEGRFELRRRLKNHYCQK